MHYLHFAFQEPLRQDRHIKNDLTDILLLTLSKAMPKFVRERGVWQSKSEMPDIPGPEFSWSRCLNTKLAHGWPGPVCLVTAGDHFDNYQYWPITWPIDTQCTDRPKLIPSHTDTAPWQIHLANILCHIVKQYCEIVNIGNTETDHL